MQPHGPVSLNPAYFLQVIYNGLKGVHVGKTTLMALFLSIWGVVMVVGYIISFIALVIITYATIQLYDIRTREFEQYGPLPTPSADQHQPNPRWLNIQDLMTSTNPSDWRQAIIEADIMLGEMLTRQGYQGTSIGEQLKQVEPADFLTLNDAWEAHKVRNEIAHGGTAFELSDTLAKRTIARYSAVFREFEMT